LSRRLPSLYELNLDNNTAVGDEGAAVLATSPRLAGLRSLTLYRCGITAAGAKALAASPHLGRLRYLRLRDNPIGSEGALALARSPTRPALRRLEVSEGGLSRGATQELKERFGKGLSLFRW